VCAPDARSIGELRPAMGQLPESRSWTGGGSSPGQQNSDFARLESRFKG
jgi:hypothetical protein